MAQADFGTGKTLIVLAIVLGCFAILWPKIFYPMMQTAFAMTAPKVDSDGRLLRDTERPPHLHPASATPRGRGSPADDLQGKFMMREGRPFPHPEARQPAKSQPKSGGAMSIIMPIYTVGIVVFFLYTVLKLVFKKPNEGDKKPLIKDFHMDPEYRKFVCQQPIKESIKPPKVEKVLRKQPKLCETSTPETESGVTKELDPKDFEIFKLRKKLEETEHAMERIMKHMGVVNACLTERVQLENKITDTQDSDIRQRHKGNAKQKPGKSRTSKKCHIEEVTDEPVDCDSIATLEEDLSELISLCKATDESIKSHAETPDEKTDNSIEKEGERSSETGSSDDEAHQDVCFEDKSSCNANGCCKNTSCA